MNLGEEESNGLDGVVVGFILLVLRRLVEGPFVIDCIVDGSVSLESSRRVPPPKLPI